MTEKLLTGMLGINTNIFVSSQIKKSRGSSIIFNFINFRRGRPLWCYEDITPKTLVTHSATQLESFLNLIVKFFKHLSPLALVEQRWSQVAMQLALSCSSRHYAGRSFEVMFHSIVLHSNALDFVIPLLFGCKKKTLTVYLRYTVGKSLTLIITSHFVA